MIQNISIDLLLPHPRNPRQDVGDITELADSIKENGVMQNLTIVPTNDGLYYVVIGNRRLAAAGLAGLKELPCVISNMDEQTQQSTMLLENMQRVDLTPYEQAEGFQMCLDFGMNENELKQKTGFSKNTIKHRLSLLLLDKEKFKKGVDRGATIQDYIDLEQIEDKEIKNTLLGVIGTNDFRYKLNNEKKLQKDKRDLEKFILKISAFMEEVVEMPEGYRYEDYIYGSIAINNFKMPEDLEERKYVFKKNGNYSVQIYKEKLEADKANDLVITNASKVPTQAELNIEEIQKKAKVAYETRLEFAKNVFQSYVSNLKSNIEIRYAFCLNGQKLNFFSTDEYEIFKKVTGMDLDDIDLTHSYFDTSKNANRLLFALVYANLDSQREDITVNTWSYSNDYGKYEKCNKEEIKELYTFLENYGYQVSDEEIAIMFGTHDLYLKGE